MSPQIFEHPNMYLDLAFSADGQYLVAASCDANYRPAHSLVWNMKQGQLQARFQEDHINAIAMSPTSYRLATSNRANVSLWDIPSGQLQRTLLERKPQGKFDNYTGLAFSPGGRMLAVCSEEGFGDVEGVPGQASILIVDIERGDVIATLTKEDDGRSITKVQFLPDGERVVGFSYEYDYTDRVYVWDVAHGTKLTTFDRDDGDTKFLGVSQSGRFLATTGFEPRLWKLDKESYLWELIANCAGHQCGVLRLAFSPDEKTLITAGEETLAHEGSAENTFSIRSWDTVSGQKRVLMPAKGKFYCMGISPDSRRLATMSGEVGDYFNDDVSEYMLRVWDLSSGQEQFRLPTESRKTNLLFHAPYSLLFSPDGQRIAVSHLRHVEVWDMTCYTP